MPEPDRLHFGPFHGPDLAVSANGPQTKSTGVWRIPHILPPDHLTQAAWKKQAPSSDSFIWTEPVLHVFSFFQSTAVQTAASGTSPTFPDHRTMISGLLPSGSGQSSVQPPWLRPADSLELVQ